MQRAVCPLHKAFDCLRIDGWAAVVCVGGWGGMGMRATGAALFAELLSTVVCMGQGCCAGAPSTPSHSTTSGWGTCTPDVGAQNGAHLRTTAVPL